MGLSVPHLLVVLAIVVLVFGTKRLKNVGGDLGDAIKGFRNAVKEGEELENQSQLVDAAVIGDAEKHKA